MKKIYLLFTIVRRERAELVEELLHEYGVGISYSTPCNGTAHQTTLDLLGLVETEKTLIASVFSGSAKEILDTVKLRMGLHLPDSGIAFTVPISGLDGLKTLEYLTGSENISETEEDTMEFKNDLVIAICENGYTELVMDAARAAGATGGTTIKAKGTGNKNAEKFFGMSIADEKELVLIVCPTAIKGDIMRAIKRDAGAESKAHSLVISLPVSDVEGFGGQID